VSFTIKPVTVTAEAAVNKASSVLRLPLATEKGNINTKVPMRIVIKKELMIRADTDFFILLFQTRENKYPGGNQYIYKNVFQIML
jgi:hypothetical protein